MNGGCGEPEWSTPAEVISWIRRRGTLDGFASNARCGGVVSFGTFGADVPVDGEPVVVSSYVADVENIRPQARFTTTVESGGLRLDASSSVDRDGTITSYDWYVSTAAGDTVIQGPVVNVPWDRLTALNVTLVVTDKRGLTDFRPVCHDWCGCETWFGDQPCPTEGKGSHPDSASFDALTAVDATSLTVGPNKFRTESHVKTSTGTASSISCYTSSRNRWDSRSRRPSSVSPGFFGTSPVSSPATRFGFSSVPDTLGIWWSGDRRRDRWCPRCVRVHNRSVVRARRLRSTTRH